MISPWCDMDMADIFKALSNKSRLRIFEIIREGHRAKVRCPDRNRPTDIPDEAVCVCEILEEMNISQSTVSHHLKELRWAGLVEVFPRGRWAYYTIKPGVLEKIEKYFFQPVRGRKQKSLKGR